MIILGFDGLEPSLVEKWNINGFKQISWGKTNLEEYELLRTVVLWAGFLTGKNLEEEISNQTLWDVYLDPNETFLKFYDGFTAIDVPSFSYKKDQHKKERAFLKEFFSEQEGGRSELDIIEDFDKTCWRGHEENKREFFEALNTETELVFGYFGLTDTIAHLSFGNKEKMKNVYDEAVKVTKKAKKVRPRDTCLIISDHGMKEVGPFGDHAREGFWSLNRNSNLENPKITDFFEVIKELRK